MAIFKNQLLEQLDTLRQTIIDETLEHSGVKINVCSDETLREIAMKKPMKTSDFLAISGINKQFMNKYASRFLQVIYQDKQKSIHEVSVSSHAYQLLDHYKDRLTNISKRNTNLYMSKLRKKQTLDLTRLNIDQKIIEFLTNKRLSVLTLNQNELNLSDQLVDDLTYLYREINKSSKESGSYDLYIAYPFIEMQKTKDHFIAKAPLLYFPVKLIRSKRVFSIKKDKDKDIQYNRDLILALSKMDKSKIDTKTIFTEDFNLKNIKDEVIPFYEKHGIDIKEKNIDFSFEPFINERKTDFIKRSKHKSVIKNYITLGRYKLYGSMIQKDIHQILNNHKYNDLLEGLIDETGLYDDDQSTFEIKHKNVKESNISYISDLNYSQEKVIDLLNKEKKLVIWGPPGTGKSQTITNLIASSVLKGEKVLVISEKKVALDVIYSRLKDASTYAMFIDDAQNKQQFYEKVKDFIDPMPPKRSINNDVYDIEHQIDTLLSTFDQALKLLYTDKINGRYVYTLYNRYVKDKDIIKDLLPLKVNEMFDRYLKNISFDQLDVIEASFSKKKHLDEYIAYQEMVRSFPVIQKLESKMTRSQKILFQSFDQAYQTFMLEYKKSWVLKKRKLRKTFIKNYKDELSFLADKQKYVKAYLKNILKDNRLHMYMINHLKDMNRIKTKYNQLNDYHYQFIHMLLDDVLVKDVEDISQYKTYLFDAYYTGYLEKFAAKHQQYLFIMDKYQDKINALNDLLKMKQQVSNESFEMALYRHALDFSNTKRIMDIKRSVDATKRMSVKSFIDIFQLELMNHVRIWMMTPEVVSAVIPLVYGMFDLVIFDEASQMYVEKGIPAIYRAKKVVIAGDTKQLRPSSLGIGRLEDDDQLYEGEDLKDMSKDAKSLLDLARYRYQETVLNYHYRSSYEELIAFSNHAFYEGKLIVSPNQYMPKKPPIEYVYVKQGVFDKRRNVAEAQKVIELLRHIFKTRKNNETIGVITFNSTQRDLIENLIDEQLFKSGKYQKLFEKELFRTKDGEDQSLFVKNIENVQGDERDIIIFSMGYGRDPHGQIRRNFGWLNNEGGQNRLNVAISRAKQKIYFVSSLYPEELKVEDLKSVGPKLLKDYMRYCYYVSNKQSDDAKRILESLSENHQRNQSNENIELVEQIKKRLERSKYTVKTNVGIGGYTIDLAIYDALSHTYQLGIICDVSSTKDVDARKDLLHLEKYLKARSWKLYRVFASNWYKDPNHELRQIRSILKNKI